MIGETNICSFCKEEKIVLRQYLHAKNKKTDSDGFEFIYYCNDCGLLEQVKTTHNTREEVNEQFVHFMSGMYGFGKLTDTDGANTCMKEGEEWLQNLLTTAAQEKEEAVAEVVERWRKSIDDEGRSCSVKIEEAVKAERKRRNAAVKEYRDEGVMFILKVEDGKTYEASMPIPKWNEVGPITLRSHTPPKNISSETTAPDDSQSKWPGTERKFDGVKGPDAV